jgi:PEP-CTERM/exosortase A-associated glycosyltransferase
MHEIEGLRVYGSTENNFGSLPFVKEARLMKILQSRIEEVVNKEKPDIIHAHSPSLNGIPALRAGRKYKIPVVYEVRALWEDAAVDHGTFSEKSLKYAISRFVETKLMERVDALFAICKGIKSDIVSRGILSHKVTVIPNCVDSEFFTPEKYDEDIAEQFGLKDKFVFGYIGSFYQYEGIDILLESYAKILKSGIDSRLLLVGDGPEKAALQDRADKLGIFERVIFAGKIPNEQIKRHYSVIDVLIYPRKKIRLTELVTPLKPLEAMAMGKVVVGSDVGGIKELITHNKDGFLFQAGDVASLAALLVDIVAGKKDLYKVSGGAIETVQKERNWKTSVSRYLPIYESLSKKSN